MGGDECVCVVGEPGNCQQTHEQRKLQQGTPTLEPKLDTNFAI